VHVFAFPVTYACNITENDCELHRSVLAINAKHTPNTFKFRKLKRQDVLTALEGINPNKAARYNMLPPRVLKIAAEQMATPLTTIFNQAIEDNHWPNVWKKGEDPSVQERGRSGQSQL